jgi:hypothetical protein
MVSRITAEFAMVKIGAPIAGQTVLIRLRLRMLLVELGNRLSRMGMSTIPLVYRSLILQRSRTCIFSWYDQIWNTRYCNAFTLPIGYRPSAAIKLPMNINGAMQSVDINPDGTVVPTGGSAADTRILEGLSFKL